MGIDNRVEMKTPAEMVNNNSLSKREFLKTLADKSTIKRQEDIGPAAIFEKSEELKRMEEQFKK